MLCYNSIVPSSSPTAVVIRGHNPASLKVSWRLPSIRNRNGEITGHVIQYTRVGSQTVITETITNETTHIITGLLGYVNYSISVAAKNVNGTGRFSSAVVQRSGQDSEFNM